MSASDNAGTGPVQKVPKPKLSQNGKILLVLLVVFVICDILLSPIGFETRGSEILSHASSVAWFGGLIVGLVLNIAALVVLFFRPRASSILAIVGSLVYIAVIIGDQAHLIWDTPPAAITDVEIVTVIVLVAVISFASRIYAESRPKMTKTQETFPK